MPKTPKEIEKIIIKDGWYLSRTGKGSHKVYEHPIKKGIVVIPFHNRQLATQTLKSICIQAQIDWRKYK